MSIVFCLCTIVLNEHNCTGTKKTRCAGMDVMAFLQEELGVAQASLREKNVAVSFLVFLNGQGMLTSHARLR